MKKLALILCLCFLSACKQSPNQPFDEAAQQATEQTNNSALIDAFKNKKSDIFLEGSGVVKKLLADDNKGSRHQKFLVAISPQQTLLFAHNIDLAPRVADIQVGDALSFRGEYIYNPKGGVIHWTHHYPNDNTNDNHSGKHAGWIKHKGNTYQ